jgi:hypothetical protein
MNAGLEANSFVVKLARAVPGNLFEEALARLTDEFKTYET